jgi:carboxymethylenebutenolidase
MTLRDHPQDGLEVATEYGNAGLWQDGTALLEQTVAAAKDKGHVSPLVYYYLSQFAERMGDGQKAAELVQKYAPTAPEELQKVFDALKIDKKCTGKVGSVGFCFGGRMSLALGISRPLDAICTFYGGGMQQLFDQLDNLKSPVLGLFGDKDVSIPVGTIEQFDRLLGKIGVHHEVIVYPDSGHAFFRDSDPSVYKPEAAKDAWARATKFFAKHLK